VTLTDTHCHLNLKQFDTDLEKVISRAKDAGVERILVPGIDLESSRKAVSLASQFSQTYAAVGVHPNTEDGWPDDCLSQLNAISRHPKVVAIGEIGLDNHWKDTNPAYQERIFREQLNLAAHLQKPVLVHSRDALDNLFPILQEWAASLTTAQSPLLSRAGVLHAFEGSLEQANQAIQIGFFIGLAGPITFRNAPEKHLLAQELPLERILIETDSPYLTPHPFRGTRNEPAYVHEVAKALADFQKVDLEKILKQTAHNAETLFYWSH